MSIDEEKMNSSLNAIPELNGKRVETYWEILCK